MRWTERAGAADALMGLAERLLKWTPLVIAAIVGGWSGWMAKASTWLHAYGPISWVFAGLLAMLIFAAAYYLVALGLDRYARSRWIRKIPNPEQAINPLDTNFTSRKIDINTFRTPFTSEVIEGKTFIGCHLIGPAIVTFVGNATLRDSKFLACDFVAVADKAAIHNVIAFKDITVQGSSIYNLTILVPPNVVASIPNGANWITGH